MRPKRNVLIFCSSEATQSLLTVVLRDCFHVLAPGETTRPDVIVFSAPSLPIPTFSAVPTVDLKDFKDMRSLREAVKVACVRKHGMKAALAPEVRASLALPLKDAWWCVNCGCITNQSAWCPCCSATDLYPLARFLDRKPKEAA